MGHGLSEQLCVALAGGLLSSSCCVIQLALNAASIGCAGFGTLTPYRPLFAALTASSLAYTHSLYKDRRRTAIAAVLALALTSTPELVRRYNIGNIDSAADLQTVRMQVTGLKCESCAARLKQAVQSSLPEAAASCSMEYATGMLTVFRSSLKYQDLLGIVHRQGFDASLLDPSAAKGNDA